MNVSAEVNSLIKKYFWEMSDDVSLRTGNQLALPEEAADFIEEYTEKFGVD